MQNGHFDGPAFYKLNIYGMTFDANKATGVDIRGGGNVNLHCPYFDTVPPAVAVKIAPGVSSCIVTNPYFSGPTPRIIDNRSKSSLVLNVSGMSANNIKAGNLRGQVTISDTNKEGIVRFPVKETDEKYFVTATVVSVEGGAASGARNVYVAEKSPVGFKVRLAEAPGAKNVVKVDWIMVR